MEFKTMTLSQCSKFDWDNNLRNKLTGWGKICIARREKGISRKAIRMRKAAQQKN